MSVRVTSITLEIMPTAERVNIRQLLVGMGVIENLTPIKIDHQKMLDSNRRTQIELSGSVLTFKSKDDNPLEVVVEIGERPQAASPHQPGRSAEMDERRCSEIPMPGGGECVLKEQEEPAEQQ